MKNMYDVIVVGGGPAGLTAAIYLARAKYRVLVVEEKGFGGQITITSEVVNYPGVLETSGKALTETMRKQAENFGAEFMLAKVTKLDMDGDVKTVHTSRGELKCFGVLVATGSHPRAVGFKGEEEFKGHGVAYCATCDGEFFTGKDIYVIGGGFAAAEEAVFLTKYGKHVTIMMRGDDFKCAESASDAARNHEKITVLTNTVVEEVVGDSVLRSITYKNTKTGDVTTVNAPDGDTFGVFVFAGYEPETGLLEGLAELDPQGYIITDANQKTSVDGLYAAGDVCVKNLRQVVTAVADGAIAATELERYSANLQKKTGIVPEMPSAGAIASGDEDEISTGTSSAKASSLFSAEILAQLNTVFSRMENNLVLKLYLDNKPVSTELKNYMEAMAELSDKVTVEISADDEPFKPCVRVCKADGTPTGLAFHGVPGGHEFTSFVLGLYNAAGPGQTVDPDLASRVAKLNKQVDIKLLVTLSCTMCPDLVIASQWIAGHNPNVTTEVYDVMRFPTLRDKYKVLSVPCMVINDDVVSFGKKDLAQVVEMLEGV